MQNTEVKIQKSEVRSQKCISRKKEKGEKEKGVRYIFSRIFFIKNVPDTLKAPFALVLFCSCVLLTLCGCSPSDPTISSDASPVETALFSKLATPKKIAAAAEEVLAGMHFEIDKADPGTGYIKTRPLPGAQFFEFWRSDNIGTENQLLANLHSIRRTVEIKVSGTFFMKKMHEKMYQTPLSLDCKVHLQRLAMPERQPAHATAASSARAYEMFTLSSPAMQTLRLTSEQLRQAEWIDLGRDTALENEIVKRIKTKILTSE